MKRSELLKKIEAYLEEHSVPKWLDVPHSVQSDAILYIMEYNGMRPTEEDDILLKRHVTFWERE